MSGETEGDGFGDRLMANITGKSTEPDKVKPAVTTVVLNTSSDPAVENRAKQWKEDGDRQNRPTLEEKQANS